MFIKDLQPRQTKVDVEGEVIEISDVREFSKFGKQGKVATAHLRDTTGRIKLSLWNEQTGLVKSGDTVKVTNGYVNEFQGEMQLTTGKFGAIEVIKKDGSTPEAPAASTPATPHREIPAKPKKNEDLDVEEEDFS